MQTITLESEFVKANKIEVLQHNDGGFTIVFPLADFLVYSNKHKAIAASTFAVGGDDTLPVKDLLIDELQYVDYMQKLDNGDNAIDRKFK